MALDNVDVVDPATLDTVQPILPDHHIPNR